MRSCRAGLDERRRSTIGNKSTNRPNQNSRSAHRDATRPASAASATRNTPTALVRLSAGNHPHASDADPVMAELLLDTTGNSGDSSLIAFILATSFARSMSAAPLLL